ncbi:MAG TPA: DUF3793 family protein [Candidatus Limiplasma sp.]|nr:DUF3793 family protein [Candidatus Limiplasma sp.]
MLEKLMIRYGAPTLAGMKTGSLFNADADDAEALKRETERINRTIEGKGARLTVLKQGKDRTLFYLYREALLTQCLTCPKAQATLRECGYGDFTVCGALATLRQRLEDQELFPHEIGLFLGYPLADVTGFMRNRGQNCLLCGCWKVYGQADEAMRIFARYRKCTSIYSKQFYTGTPLAKLTVAAKPA